MPYLPPTVRLLPLLLAALLPCLLPAQTRSGAELRRERKALQLQLAKTTRDLERTASRRTSAFERANLLRQQVEQRTALVETLRTEIERNDVHLRRDSAVVADLETDLQRMRAEYARSLRVQNRQRFNQDWLVFLLSATSWNQALRRSIYLRQYRNYRRRQATMIRRTSADLRRRYDVLATERLTQDSLLLAAVAEDSTLRVELTAERAALADLTAKEKKLLRTVKAQEKKDRELEAAIREVIRSVIARDEAAARDRARRNRSNPTPANAPPAPAAPRLGATIATQRGYLAWPARGPVTQTFGEHPHPKLPRLKIRSNGIDIGTPPSTRVNAVYAGNVMSVRQMPGAGHLVMVRHGEYYSVYAGVEFPAVRAGQEVTAGQQLGLTPASGDPLHFELWKGKVAQNPERWLR